MGRHRPWRDRQKSGGHCGHVPGAGCSTIPPPEKNTISRDTRVDFDTLLAESDIVSAQCAAGCQYGKGLGERRSVCKMKKSAIFLNLGRGPIVVEKDLAEALKSGTIAAAGLDVLSAEPMRADNPLREIKDSDKLMITPHIAWASIEARTRLMKIIEGQIREFFHS